MSDFDVAAVKWYQDNVNDFTKRHGLIPMLVSETGIKGHVRSLFFRALEMIEATRNKIEAKAVAAATPPEAQHG